MFTSLARADVIVVTTAQSKSVPVTEVILRISSLGLEKHEHMNIVEADRIDRLGLRMSLSVSLVRLKDFTSVL